MHTAQLFLNQPNFEMSDENAPQCDCTPAEKDDTASDDSDFSSRCCMKQRYWSMLRNERFTDICFVVGAEPETQRIRAHKAVLSVGSSVFETMFNENWSSKSGEIQVVDVEPVTFLSLLRFLYIDDIQLTADSVVKILYTAKKYAVRTLENQCISFLEKQLCPENACVLLTQARLFDQPKLMESCLDLINDNSDDVFASEDFTSVDLPTLRLLLERDTLKIWEVDLFEAVIRWSVAECQRQELTVNAENQKTVLKDTLSLVRFPLMTQKEFASKVVPLGLLSYEELAEMFLFFSDSPRPSLSFSDQPRSSKHPIIVNRYERISSGWVYSGHLCDAIRLTFDSNVKLLGFGFYGLSLKQEADYGINLTVRNHQSGLIMYQGCSVHRSSVSSYTFRVLLTKSVQLTANTSYAIIAKIQGPLSFYGDLGLKVAHKIHPRRNERIKITFENFEDDSLKSQTDVSRGQIPEILIDW